MKTFLTIIFISAALLGETCYADPPAPSPAPSSSGNPANAASNPGGQNNQTGAPHATSQTPNNPGGSGGTQTGNSPANATSANPPPASVNPPPPPGSSQTAVAAKPGSPGNKTTASKHSATQPSGVCQPVAPMFKDARTPGPARAVVGGSAKNKTTAVISGATIQHKP